MKFIIQFNYLASIQSVTFMTEEERDGIFQKILKADWGKPFLIQSTVNGHKTDIVVNLPKLCNMCCINDE